MKDKHTTWVKYTILMLNQSPHTESLRFKNINITLVYDSPKNAQQDQQLRLYDTVSTVLNGPWIEQNSVYSVILLQSQRSLN